MVDNYINRLNEKDNQLLAFCGPSEHNYTDISKHLGISLKNTSVRIDKLLNMRLIEVTVHGKGREKLVRTIGGSRIPEYYVKILRKLLKRGGRLNQEEFIHLLPFNINDLDGQDQFSAPISLLYTKYVQKEVSLTKEGKQFLKDYRQYKKK